jgi:MFS transporter, SP family, sugar:H+ symporter
MDMSVVPVYQAEIAPAENRGFTVGTYQFIISFAQIVTNAVCRATGSMNSNASWRIPLGLFFWPPAVVASAVWLLPESPRWLALQNRNEEARSALVRLRAPKFSQTDIDIEFQGIIDAIEKERQQEKGSFKDLFKGVNLRRTWLVVTCNCFLAGTGANFANLYGAYFIQQMHFTNPFTVTLCSSIGICLLTLFNMVAMDRYGRRSVFMVILTEGVKTDFE